MTLSDRYRTMPNERLLQITLSEADGLTPEAVEVLHAELASRGLDASLGHAVDTQRRTLLQREIGTLAEAIRRGPCPMCGRTDAPVDACTVAEATSALIVTNYSVQTVVGCDACRDAAAKRAAKRTALLGLWGLPFGPIQTVRALWKDIAVLRRPDPPSPSDDLLAFVEQNPGPASALTQSATSEAR